MGLRTIESMTLLRFSGKGKWMFFDHFTLADISLTVLLFRIKKLGLQHKFWIDGSLPKVAAYLESVLKEPFTDKTLF